MRMLGLSEWWWLIKAWCVAILVRLLLALLPYGTLVRWLDRTSPLCDSRLACADLVAAAVMRATRLVPFSTCLVQALTGRWLLRRAGEDAQVRFGVAFGTEGFQAHAWLDAGERILIGAREAVTHESLERHGNG